MNEPTEKQPENIPPETEAPAPDAAAVAIAALKQEVDGLKDKLLRAVAETDNVRKRGQRDVEETSKYAVTGLARDLVSVAENLQRAVESLPPEQRAGNPALKSLGDGVEMTLKELLGAFERHNIRRITPLGEKFDHNYHQAVLQVENPDEPAGTVVQVLQAGYVIHDRLLKPAMVGVVKAGDAAKKLDTSA